MVWEVVFLLLILKIPVVYLCWVVWWAIKAEPRPPLPLDPVRRLVVPGPGPQGDRRRLSRRAPWRSRGPHGAPRRSYARHAEAVARAGDDR